MTIPDDGTAVKAKQPRAKRTAPLKRFASWFRRRRVPYVQQNTSADCGIACVAMVLGWYGRRVRLSEIRNALDAGRDGNNASDLMELAREYDLDGHGVTLKVADLDRLPPAAILHVDFSHFVVFESRDRHGVNVVDPAFGRRKIGYEEFGRRFTGVALVFEPTDSFEPGGRTASPVRHYVRQVLTRSGMLLKIFSLSALLQLIGLGLPILTGLLVDRVIPAGNVGMMQILALGFVGVIGFHFLTTFLRSYLMLYLRTELDARMTLDFLEYLFDLPFSFFQTRSAGDLMMRLNSNASVREIITSSALSGALDGFMVISYLVVLLIISPLLGGLVVLLGFLRVLVYLASRHRIRELMTENLAKEALSQDYQVQIFAGVETLKAAGAEPRALEHWRHLFYDVLNVNVLRGRLDALIQSLIGALSFGSPLVILLVGGQQVIAGNLSLGTMLALSALSAGFLAPLASLVSMGLALERLGSFVDRLEDVLATSPEQDPDKVTPAPRLSGSIRVESVTFRYHRKSAPAVRDVSTEIEPGQLVAIVGRTAAGKTTLAYLLLGLHRPTTGRILFDGRDLTSLEARSVRSQLGVVTQHPYLFGGTIRDNIALTHPDLPMDRIERAAQLAHIHDEIVAMPMQYNTLLAGGGQSLSGGQRQRIALARALAQDPAILLLDEATSAVDAETEREIQSSLAGIGCTRIVIAHRLSTVRRARQILVLDQGQLVERGTHDELIAGKGTYFRLVRAQASDGNGD